MASITKNEMRKLRLSIGILGLMLPGLLYFGHNRELLSSMSHYYYTASSVFFIGIIFSFAVILYSYYGYEKLPHERFSDNTITSLAALFALLTVLVPTSSANSGGVIFFEDAPYLFGHKSDTLLNTIHLASAGIFICLLGVMCYFKFTLSPKNSKILNSFYKACGLIVWLAIALIVIFMLYEEITDTRITSFYYVWWFECLAIVAFAVAWIRKSKTLIFMN